MSRLHGKDGVILLNTLAVTSQINGWSFEHRRNYTMVACVGDSGERWDPGLLAGAVTLKGFTNTTAGLYTQAVAANNVDNSLQATILPGTSAVGSLALMTVSDFGSYDIPAVVTDSVGLTVNGQPDNGVDMGVLLHVLGAETADGNSTSVDNTASSASGSVNFLHVTAFSGFTSVVFKVQHSTDNSSWSDLATFTTVTALTKERVTTTGTVNRYLRGFWDVTGTGSVTFAIAAARR